MDSLVVAPCDHEAAKYAVMHWHYSQAMPVGKLIRYGAWEHDRFIGVVLFGRGASPALGVRYDLDQTAACELVRVALTHHEVTVTSIIKRALNALKRDNPRMRLVVSFADTSQGHHGGIYQAGNWIYVGTSASSIEHYYRGKWYHSRMLRPTGWGTVPEVARLTTEEQRALPTRRKPGKHRYLYPLDKAMRRQIAPLALTYPQRADEGSGESHPTSGREGQVRSLPSAPIAGG